MFAANAYVVMLGETFNLAPTDGFNIFQAGAAEMLYTFMLCFVFLNTACSKKHAPEGVAKDQFYGLAIGFCVVAGGYGAGAISGGYLNPAAALGVDVSSTRLGFGYSLIYLIFEVAGAILAAAMYTLCRPDDYDDSVTDYPLKTTVIAEFLGTYMLMLTTGLNVLAPNGSGKEAGSKAAVFSIAASFMCMNFALASCSGGHFNPAVTYAVFRRGKFEASQALAYAVVQVLAAVFAACTYIFMLNFRVVALKPKDNSAYVGEFMFTFLLVFVFLSVCKEKWTTESALSQYFGLAIGFCITAGGLAIGSLSGGCLNPAVTAGIGLTSGTIGTFLAYSGVQFFAGEVAAGVFKLLHATDVEGPSGST
jgi:aquaporin Z